MLRFVNDLDIPPTSNQTEHDLRPSEIQQNLSGRLTNEQRAKDRYKILGYVSSIAKNRLDNDACPSRRDPRPVMDAAASPTHLTLTWFAHPPMVNEPPV